MQHASILKVVHWIFVTRSSCRAHPAFTALDLSFPHVAKLVRYTGNQVPRRDDTLGREDKYSRILDIGTSRDVVGVTLPAPSSRLQSDDTHWTVAYREGGGVWGVQTPPPEIPKISMESSIAQARRTGVSISFCSSLCSHRVVIY